MARWCTFFGLLRTRRCNGYIFKASVTVRPAASLSYHHPIHERDAKIISAVDAPKTLQMQVFGGVTSRSPLPWQIRSTAGFLGSMIKALQGPSILECSVLSSLWTSRTSSHWVENLGSFDQDSHTSGPTGSGIKVDSPRSRSPRAFYINFQPRHKIGDSNPQHHEAFETSIMTTTNPGSANSTRLTHACPVLRTSTVPIFIPKAPATHWFVADNKSRVAWESSIDSVVFACTLSVAPLQRHLAQPTILGREKFDEPNIMAVVILEQTVSIVKP